MIFFSHLSAYTHTHTHFLSYETALISYTYLEFLHLNFLLLAKSEASGDFVERERIRKRKRNKKKRRREKKRRMRKKEEEEEE